MKECSLHAALKERLLLCPDLVQGALQGFQENARAIFAGKAVD